MQETSLDSIGAESSGGTLSCKGTSLTLITICSTTIAIGFSSKSVSLNRAPGWEPESWGFHGDDGHIFASQNVGKHYEKPFSGGDTIGCGVNFRTQSAFFTKNGKCLGTLNPVVH